MVEAKPDYEEALKSSGVDSNLTYEEKDNIY